MMNNNSSSHNTAGSYEQGLLNMSLSPPLISNNNSAGQQPSSTNISSSSNTTSGGGSGTKIIARTISTVSSPSLSDFTSSSSSIKDKKKKKKKDGLGNGVSSSSNNNSSNSKKQNGVGGGIGLPSNTSSHSLGLERGLSTASMTSNNTSTGNLSSLLLNNTAGGALQHTSSTMSLVSNTSSSNSTSNYNHPVHFQNHHQEQEYYKGRYAVLEKNRVGFDDLAEMKDFDEEVLINIIQSRFKKGIIYTNIGPILVSVNPYQNLHQLHTQDLVKIYNERRGLPPHLFAVAEKAYSDMLDYQRSQVIFISGESGSGKSENSKIIVQYLLANNSILGNNGSSGSNSNLFAAGRNLKDLILESSSILESFGHCTTDSNSNSSRYGKYFEIYYSNYGHIQGARIYNYFLDESRVIFQNKGERNFHIFYQFLSGLNEDEKLQSHITDTAASSYHYLNQGGGNTTEADYDAFERLRMAFQLLNFTNQQLDNIFKTLSFILHLGNIAYYQQSKNTKVEFKDRPYFEQVSRAISFDVTKLEMILLPSNPPVNTIHEAIEIRDSLARSIYSSLFHWIIDILNSKLKPISLTHHTIGILDLFGQENTQLSGYGYEQFSINYLEEQLQQIYIQNVLKNEQEEYKKEKIPWNSPISFKDNEDSVEIMEKIVNLLDQESKNPSSTDIIFLEKLQNFLKNHHLFSSSLKQKKFGIEHFFGQSFYDVKGFIQKNRDEIYQKSSNLYKSSIIKYLIDNNNNSNNSNSSCNNSSNSKSNSNSNINNNNNNNNNISSKRSPLSIIKLLPSSSTSNYHFIRCLRPNAKKTPVNFDVKLVNEQVTFLNLMERMKENYQTEVESIQPPPMQMGSSRIFLRYTLGSLLEVERQKKKVNSAITIQKNWKMYLERKRFSKLKRVTVNCQRLYRKTSLQRRSNRVSQAACILQNFFKMVLDRMRFLCLKQSTIAIQTFMRTTLSIDYVDQVIKYNSSTSSEKIAQVDTTSSGAKPPVLPLSLIVHISPSNTPPTSPTVFYPPSSSSSHKDHATSTTPTSTNTTPTTTSTTSTTTTTTTAASATTNSFSSPTSTSSTGLVKPPGVRPSNSSNMYNRDIFIGSVRKELSINNSNSHSNSNNSSNHGHSLLNSSPTLTPLSSPTPNQSSPNDSPMTISPPVSPRAPLESPRRLPFSTPQSIPNQLQLQQPQTKSPVNLLERSIAAPFYYTPFLPTNQKSSTKIGFSVNVRKSTQIPLEPQPLSPGKGTNPISPRQSPRSNSSMNIINPNTLTSSGSGIPNSTGTKQLSPSSPSFTHFTAPNSSAGNGGGSIGGGTMGITTIGGYQYKSITSMPTSTSKFGSLTQSRDGGPIQPPIYKSTALADVNKTLTQWQSTGRKRSKSFLKQQHEDEDFKFIDYAKQFFTAKTKKSIINRKKLISYESLVSYSKKLTNSLHELNDSLEKVALDIFTHILMYMGDIELKKPLNTICSFIVRQGIEIVELREEIYSQILKQLNNHPGKKENKMRGWELLSLCCGSFAPNGKLTKYVLSFLWSHKSDPEADQYAQICSKRLEQIILRPRTLPPLPEEIEALRRKVPPRVPFLFPDEVAEPVDIESYTTAGDIIDNLIIRSGLQSDVNVWAVYEVYKNKERSINRCEYILDVIGKWDHYYQSLYNSGQPQQDTLTPFQFYFKIQLFLKPQQPPNPHEVDFLFFQLIRSISKSLLPITFQETIKISALRLHYDKICNLSLNQSDYWPRYVPEKMLMLCPAGKWAELIQAQHLEYSNLAGHVDLTKEEMRDVIIAHIMSLPFYGSTVFFDCVQDQWSEIETGALEGFHVVVDVYGVHIYSKDSMDQQSIKTATSPPIPMNRSGNNNNIHNNNSGSSGISKSMSPNSVGISLDTTDSNDNDIISSNPLNISNNFGNSGTTTTTFNRPNVDLTVNIENNNNHHSPIIIQPNSSIVPATDNAQLYCDNNNNSSNNSLVNDQSLSKSFNNSNNSNNNSVAATVINSNNLNNNNNIEKDQEETYVYNDFLSEKGNQLLKVVGKPIKHATPLKSFSYSSILECGTEEGKTVVLSIDQEDLLIQTPQAGEMVLLINTIISHFAAESKTGIAQKDYSAPGALSFKKGDLITDIVKVDDKGWCTGTCKGITGQFPIEFVNLTISSTSNAPVYQQDSDFKRRHGSYKSSTTTTNTSSSSSSTPNTTSSNNSNNIPPIPSASIKKSPNNNTSPTVSPTSGNTTTTTTSSGSTKRQPTSPTSGSNSGANTGTSPNSSNTSTGSKTSGSKTNKGKDRPHKKGKVDQPNLPTFESQYVEIGSKHPLMSYALNRFRQIPAFKLGDALRHSRSNENHSIFTADLPSEYQPELNKIFSDIMGYMSDVPVRESKTRLLQSIITKGINKPALRDEIYFFLCRQLTPAQSIDGEPPSPSPEATRKGMVLFSLCAGCFPSSAEMFPSLKDFLSKTDNLYSGYCIKKLQSTSLKGPRLYAPSKKEIHSVKERRAITCKIHLANGPTKTIQINPSTTALDALKELVEQLELTYVKEFAIYKYYNGTEICLKDHEKLADYLKIFEDNEKKLRKQQQQQQLQDGSTSPTLASAAGGRFVFLRKIWIPHTANSMSSIMVELLFYQYVHDVLAGKIPHLDREKALKLAALQLQAQEGNYDPQSPIISENTVSLCIPSSLIDMEKEMKLSEWVEQINQAHAELATQTMSPEKALTNYLELCTSFPFAGTTWFAISQKRIQDSSSSVWIGVNQHVIVMFDEKMQKELERWDLDEVSGFTYRDDSFSFLVGGLMNPTRKLFYTSQGDEINEIFDIFKSLPKIDPLEEERREERKRERKAKEKRKAAKLLQQSNNNNNNNNNDENK
ncbi:hypothetical protein CYY_000612 [Polysphondylium violaceum]|uniref:Unconventional myosin heavy chain n=1 Tax=Polysphondylium violaceum TaxID=133409 RepID=A0A8J4UWZ9_9MYCE|nr:hypothetical protein CYY_000612 [Polysphondylium violaceum]